MFAQLSEAFDVDDKSRKYPQYVFKIFQFWVYKIVEVLVFLPPSWGGYLLWNNVVSGKWSVSVEHNLQKSLFCTSWNHLRAGQEQTTSLLRWRQVLWHLSLMSAQNLEIPTYAAECPGRGMETKIIYSQNVGKQALCTFRNGASSGIEIKTDLLLPGSIISRSRHCPWKTRNI